MKYKFLIPISLSIIIGLFFGRITFNQYSLPVYLEEDYEKLYFVGAFECSNLKELKDSISSYDNYLYIEKDNKVKLYVAITKEQNILNKIKDYYKEKYNNIFVDEVLVSNKSFTNILGEYDKMINLTTIKSEIENIEKIVIANYKEMVLESD